MDLFTQATSSHATEVSLTSHPIKPSKLWLPRQVLFTPEALDEAYGQEVFERVSSFGVPIEILKSNRLTGLRGATERETYKLAKSTLAVVKAPPSAFNLSPIPPSADWQFHIAQGCPAHCQYCYLAGSLSGPPVVRVYANLPDILQNLTRYQSHSFTTFEASCYTDPLGIEHLTSGLTKAIQHFSSMRQSQLRFVTKFAAVQPLLSLVHNNNTRCRISLNAPVVSRRLESGTASIPERLQALRHLALPKEQGGGGYPVGVVLAPLMPVENWKEHYSALLHDLKSTLDFACDLTFELISHRFTPGSKEMLLDWYPATSLDMDEATRAVKRTKFGGLKYVYTPDVMKALRTFFEQEIKRLFPEAPVLYWT
jgi:spore photoproduct lyase